VRVAVRQVVVVDPFSAGSGLAPAFASRGAEAIAVLTHAEPPEGLRASWYPEKFSAVHVAPDLSTAEGGELVERLAESGPLCVIPGAETGVEVAEALGDLVCPGTGNVPHLSAARRDKWQMAVALREAGVPHLRQLSSADADEVEQWLHTTGLRDAPIVLKPPKSGGTDDVYVVSPGEDWRPFFGRILGSTNKLNMRNNHVLVQELAEGTEYEVDTYSVDGRHGLAAVWRYAKERRGDRLGIYLSNTFVAPDHPVVPALFDYVQQVLDAVGVRNGPAHVEVMMTAAGPRLIEVGARMAGAGQQELSALAAGDNQIERSVRHRVGGDQAVGGYQLRQHVKTVYLSSPAAGILNSGGRLDRLAELPTFHQSLLAYRDGDVVPRTEDLWTSLGYLVLAGPSAAAMEADERTIREVEAALTIEPSARLDRSAGRSSAF
jgi:biotin carboxylase